MRQPSSLKRCTVAWPIPRLAPVRITVLLWSDMAASVAELGAAATLDDRMRRLSRRQCAISSGTVVVDEHVARGAAEDHLPQAAVAIGAHHQQVGTGVRPA